MPSSYPKKRVWVSFHGLFGCKPYMSLYDHYAADPMHFDGLYNFELIVVGSPPDWLNFDDLKAKGVRDVSFIDWDFLK